MPGQKCSFYGPSGKLLAKISWALSAFFTFPIPEVTISIISVLSYFKSHWTVEWTQILVSLPSHFLFYQHTHILACCRELFVILTYFYRQITSNPTHSKILIFWYSQVIITCKIVINKDYNNPNSCCTLQPPLKKAIREDLTEESIMSHMPELSRKKQQEVGSYYETITLQLHFNLYQCELTLFKLNILVFYFFLTSCNFLTYTKCSCKSIYVKGTSSHQNWSI